MSGMYVSFAGGIGLVSWHRLVARFDYYRKLSLLNIRRSLRGVQVVMSIIGSFISHTVVNSFPGLWD
jgi:phage gp37-like protein